MPELNLFPMSRSDLLSIEQKVAEQLGRCFGNTDSPTFILAVSGGMDSMSLMHIFSQLEISAVVCHINYKKRGEASDKDARLVQDTALRWGFECHAEQADPTEVQDQNFQQWARNYRYGLFRKLARRYKADGIAVAHHEDDQVETILQKIFRGAGLASWSAMDVWDGEIFRPLLGVSREQIEDYVQDINIPYRTDKSNLEADFARNLLRNEWLDKLGQFFPGWKQNVLRIEQQAEYYTSALEWIAGQVTDEEGINLQSFNELAPGLRKAVLLHLIKKYKPALSVSGESLDRITELRNLQTGKSVQLTPGLSVLRDREHYVIIDDRELDFESITLARKSLVQDAAQIQYLSLILAMFENPNYKHALYLDEKKISWPITIRRWEEGDVFQPLGMQGHQKVADHLTNRKISAAHKDKALVIESFEQTICAIIFPPIKNQTQPGTISEKVKCDTGTEKCLKITYRS